MLLKVSRRTWGTKIVEVASFSKYAVNSWAGKEGKHESRSKKFISTKLLYRMTQGCLTFSAFCLLSTNTCNLSLLLSLVCASTHQRCENSMAIDVKFLAERGARLRRAEFNVFRRAKLAAQSCILFRFHQYALDIFQGGDCPCIISKGIARATNISFHFSGGSFFGLEAG